LNARAHFGRQTTAACGALSFLRDTAVAPLVPHFAEPRSRAKAKRSEAPFGASGAKAAEAKGLTFKPK